MLIKPVDYLSAESVTRGKLYHEDRKDLGCAVFISFLLPLNPLQSFPLMDEVHLPLLSLFPTDVAVLA